MWRILAYGIYIYVRILTYGIYVYVYMINGIYVYVYMINGVSVHTHEKLDATCIFNENGVYRTGERKANREMAFARGNV